MSIKNIQSLDDYYSLIKNSKRERESLYNDILVKITRFLEINNIMRVYIGM